MSETQSTWNPSDKGANITLSNGNLDATGSGSTFHSVRGTQSRASGKRYFEVLLTTYTAANPVIGIGDGSFSLTTFIGNSANSAGGSWNIVTNQPYTAGWTRANSATTTQEVASDVMGVAVDLGAGAAWYARNNTWLSGNPGIGTSPSVTGISGSVFPAVSMFDTTHVVRLRTIMSQFTYTPPAGFSSWGWNLDPMPRRVRHFISRR